LLADICVGSLHLLVLFLVNLENDFFLGLCLISKCGVESDFAPIRTISDVAYGGDHIVGVGASCPSF
jgi:hypothetical protein